MMINDQLILEEAYDENYVPTEDGNAILQLLKYFALVSTGMLSISAFDLVS